MKYLKYLLLVAIGMATIASIITYKRESIVREIANSVLRDYGITATELSIDTLATDHVILSRLVLLQDDGSHYELSNISFPLSFPSPRMESISLGQLAVHPAQTIEGPLDISGYLQTFLTLPQVAPNTTVSIGKLTMPDLPILHSVVWQSRTARQQLSFGAENVDVTIDVQLINENESRATLQAGVDTAPRALETTLKIGRIDSGFNIDGTGKIDFSSWLPLLQSTDLVPRELASLNAELSGPLSITIHDAAELPLILDADLVISGDSTATYVATPDITVQVRITEAAPAKFRFEYPSMAWTASAPQSRASISTEFFAETEGTINGLACQSGIHCSLQMTFVNFPVQFGDTDIDVASFSATTDVTIGDESRVSFGADTKLKLGKVASESLHIESVDATVSGGSYLVTDGDGWKAETGNLVVKLGSVRSGDSTIGSVSLSAGMTATVADESRIELGPNSSLTLAKVESGSVRVASAKVAGIGGAGLVVNDKGWHAAVAKLDLNLESIENGSGLQASLPLSIRSLQLLDSATSLSAAYSLPANASSLNWNDTGIVAPGINGTMTLHNNTLSTSLELSADKQALTARIDASHDLTSGKGSLTVQDAALRFDRQKLSQRLKKWPYAWDIVAGNWTASAQVDWDTADSDLRTNATVTQQLDNLSGFYNDIVFTGLSSRLSATAGAGESARSDPSTFSIALLDVGIPITELSARYGIDFAGQRLNVRDLSMSVLGGKIAADPFDYALKEPSNNIMLRPQSIQLQFMIDIAEFEDVQLSGSVSGRIPVTINEKTITVADGRLESDAPGGVIRYKAGAAAAINAEINLVSRALDNFQFDSLTSDVIYTEDGDLKLKMRMSGVNPDMDALQPVVLNLGIQNNIPQLLRSLQATRAIEDVLKRKTTN